MSNYILDFVAYVGQHIMTGTHPHNKLLEATLPSNIKFNCFYEKFTDEINPDYNEYLKELTNTALDMGAQQTDIDYFISKIHPNCKYHPKTNLCLSPALPYFGPEKHFFNMEEWSFIYSFLITEHTSDMNIEQKPYHKIMLAAMRQPSFRGIMTHMNSTLNTYQFLVRNFPELYEKFIYLPIASPDTLLNIEPKKYTDKINILISNSHGGHIPAFRVRGGYEALEAVMRIIDLDNNIYLTTIGISPTVNHPRVTQLQSYISDELLNEIFQQAHIFLIPAMRIHSIGMIKSLCTGTLPIVSDGWGFDEFIKDGYNGFVARGQYGYTTWVNEHDTFVENYDANAAPSLTNSIMEKLIYILNNRDRIYEWSKNCIDYSKVKFNINTRNNILSRMVKKNYQN